MIYITAMRLVSPNGGLGVNISLHLPPKLPKTGDPWSVPRDPGPAEQAATLKEVRSGGNRVEAYLDLIFDDGTYTRERLDKVLKIIEKEIANRASNPAQMKLRDGDATVHAIFSVNLGLEDLVSKRRLLGQLREAIMRWADRYEGAIDAALARAAGEQRVAG